MPHHGLTWQTDLIGLSFDDQDRSESSHGGTRSLMPGINERCMDEGERRSGGCRGAPGPSWSCRTPAGRQTCTDARGREVDVSDGSMAGRTKRP